MVITAEQILEVLKTCKPWHPIAKIWRPVKGRLVKFVDWNWEMKFPNLARRSVI